MATLTFYLIEDYFLEVTYSDTVLFQWTTASEGPADVTLLAAVFPEPLEFTLDSANPTTERSILTSAPPGDTLVTWWEGTEGTEDNSGSALPRRQRQGTIRVASSTTTQSAS